MALKPTPVPRKAVSQLLLSPLQWQGHPTSVLLHAHPQPLYSTNARSSENELQKPHVESIRRLRWESVNVELKLLDFGFGGTRVRDFWALGH